MANPVDMIASATAEDYLRAIEVVAGDPNVDAMIVIYIPPQATKAAEIGQAIAEGIDAVGGRIPVATAWMSSKGFRRSCRRRRFGSRRSRSPNRPPSRWPRRRVRQVARSTGRIDPAFDDTRHDEAGIIANALGRRDAGWLTAEEVERLSGCYGLKTARADRTTTPRRQPRLPPGSAAGRPQGGRPRHRAQDGGRRRCARALRPAEVAQAGRGIAERVRAAGLTLDGFLVQEMVAGGVEMLVGVAHDPLFGPVVAVGAGGTTVELLRDVAIRLTPISDLDANEMVRSLGPSRSSMASGERRRWTSPRSRRSSCAWALSRTTIRPSPRWTATR